jgi:hypothetical protein
MTRRMRHVGSMSLKQELAVLAILVVLALGAARALENTTLDLAAFQQVFRING